MGIGNGNQGSGMRLEDREWEPGIGNETQARALKPDFTVANRSPASTQDE